MDLLSGDNALKHRYPRRKLLDKRLYGIGNRISMLSELVVRELDYSRVPLLRLNALEATYVARSCQYT
jgi:hypothetical protein